MTMVNMAKRIGGGAPLVLSAALALPVAAGAQAPASHSGTGQARRHVVRPCPGPAELPPLPAGIPPAAGKPETAFALRYIDVQKGTGPAAGPFQFYTVHYTGWLASDGTRFDSSLDRKEPITFQQGTHHVIPGWDEGFGGMRVGGRRRLFIPWQLAYGQLGRPPVIPSRADLIFDIELVAAEDNPPAPAAPAEPAAPAAPTPAGQGDSPGAAGEPTPPPIQPATGGSQPPPAL